MDGSDQLGVAALVVALVAVVSSSALAWQALRQDQNANHLYVTLDLLKAQRVPEFYRKERKLWDELPKHDASLGFFDLPEPVQSWAVEVAMYYQALAYVSEYGFGDRDFIAVQTHYRLVRTWQCIEAHVRGERKLRGGENTFLNAYQRFAEWAATMDVDAATARLLRRGRRLILRRRFVARSPT
jgi:hypothetical protein